MEKSLRINEEIRAPKLRVIDQNGQQLGVLSREEALRMAADIGLDLVEINTKTSPPVCKIIDYGKFCYDQSKREKENKKAQHQIRVKEIKLTPNTGDHDLEYKIKHAREFIKNGDKVKITCTFRGREMMHPEVGFKAVTRICTELEDIAVSESPMKLIGKSITVILVPSSKKKE